MDELYRAGKSLFSSGSGSHHHSGGGYGGYPPPQNHYGGGGGYPPQGVPYGVDPYQGGGYNNYPPPQHGGYGAPPYQPNPYQQPPYGAPAAYGGAYGGGAGAYGPPAAYGGGHGGGTNPLALLKTFDRDGDGQITERDFVLAAHQLGLGKVGEMVMKQAFRKFDKNRNGRLEMNEALSAITSLKGSSHGGGHHGYY